MPRISFSFGVGRLTSPNRSELESLQQELLPFMEEVRRRQHMDMIKAMFFMLTNFSTQATGLLCVGSGARELVEEAFQGGMG